MYRRIFLQNFKAKLVDIYRRIILFCLSTALITACHQTSSVHTSPQTNCRTIEHAVGEACVPLQSDRLVSLSIPTTADALALGVKPVGTEREKDHPPPYLGKKLTEIESVGTSEQPSLEKIVTLKPDLIIGLQYSGEPIYSQLSQIAPTALGDWQGYPSWKKHFNFVAEVLGKTIEAKQVWANYEKRIQKLKVALDNSYQDIEISYVYFCCNSISIDLKNSFIGTIFDDIGFSRPLAQNRENDWGGSILSEEKIPEIDGDIIFVSVDNRDSDSQETLAQLKQKPLWNQLKAVQNGQVYIVDLSTWRGGNPLAASAVIDDLYKNLVNKQ